MAKKGQISHYAAQKAAKPDVRELIELTCDGEVRTRALELLAFFQSLRMKPAWASTNSYALSYQGQAGRLFQAGARRQICAQLSGRPKSTRSRTTMPSCAAARRTNGRCSAPSSAIRSSGPAAPAEAARRGWTVTVCGKTYTGVCQCSRYITNPTERQCAFLRLMTELRRAYILETAVGTRQNLPPEK